MSRAVEIVRRRERVRTLLRLVSVLLPIAGSIFIGVVFVLRFPNLIGFLSDLNWYVYPLITAALTFGVPSALLAAYARPLAAWIVPAPGPECPDCGYSLKGARTGKCPECGSELARGIE